MPPDDEILDARDSLINALPTKEFFVDMFIRDIPLEQAVLDLVDNSIDGAKRIRQQSARLDDCYVRIELSGTEFKILDNCGGFTRETARNYAFRFGRPPGTEQSVHSIGRFGVGMKRALFKFGRHFVVHSKTTDDSWAVSINVDEWVIEPEWHFPWANVDVIPPLETPGTSIEVRALRPEVSAKFGTQQFANTIIGLIQSKHREFIAAGLRITVNGKHVEAVSLFLLVAEMLKPGMDVLIFHDRDSAVVEAKLIVGLGQSSPRDAGWYVICNGRVVLEADRRPQTGWGAVDANPTDIFIPSFHNQFSRFRGIASFDSADSGRLPWNTTKTDVDHENPIWQKSLKRMVEMMRPVIDFLNEVDKDVEEHTRDNSPLLKLLEEAGRTSTQTLQNKSDFTAPKRGSLRVELKTVKIQYSRPVADVEFLQNALGVYSAKAVGENTFDLALRKQRAE